MNSLFKTLLLQNAEKVVSFGGLEIAPAPLYFNGTSLTISDNDWNHNDYGISQTNSYYMDFRTLAEYFDSRGSNFSVIDDDIDYNGSKVVYDGHNDWRIPTSDDYTKITTIGSGSNINGTTGCKYAMITISDLSNLKGRLYFPDNGVFYTTKSFDYYNTNSSYTTCTEQELNEFLLQGAQFFPCFGIYNSGSYNWVGYNTAGCYWSETRSGTSNNTAKGSKKNLTFGTVSDVPNPVYHTCKCMVRLVREI